MLLLLLLVRVGSGDKGMRMLEFGGGGEGDGIDSVALCSSSPPHLSSFPQNPSPEKKQLPSDFRRNPDEYLRMARWKIDDLSFLVGSDLAIFGTKLHPCISLRLR